MTSLSILSHYGHYGWLLLLMNLLWLFVSNMTWQTCGSRGLMGIKRALLPCASIFSCTMMTCPSSVSNTMNGSATEQVTTWEPSSGIWWIIFTTYQQQLCAITETEHTRNINQYSLHVSSSIELKLSICNQLQFHFI